VKLEKYNYCQFQRYIARETSEFMLQDMRPLSSSDLNLMTTIKYGKQYTSAQKRTRDVSELKQLMIDM